MSSIDWIVLIVTISFIVFYGIQKTKKFNTIKDHLFLIFLRHMLVNKILNKNIESYGVLKLNEFSEKYLSNPSDFFITENHNHVSDLNIKVNHNLKSINDKNLLKILFSERKKVAKLKKVPPYVIFQESSLEEMSLKYPITIDELKNINGVGEGKARKFGDSFLKIISDYVDDNDIIRPEDLIIKSSGLNSSLKMFLIQSIDRKMPLEDIADNKGLEILEMINELEKITSNNWSAFNIISIKFSN